MLIKAEQQKSICSNRWLYYAEGSKRFKNQSVATSGISCKLFLVSWRIEEFRNNKNSEWIFWGECMKKFEITIGSGFWQPFIFNIETEDFECAQGAFDKLVDRLEAEGNTRLFIPQEEIGSYNEDQYSVGGNHGRYVLHDGIFYIREVG